MKNVQLIGELFVEQRKSKNGNNYIALVCDLGYAKKVISVNVSDIAELLGKSVVELYNAVKEVK